jgi:hypothetical protein
VDIALFWEVDGNNGAYVDQAIQWLQGTELEKHIAAGRVTTLVTIGATSDGPHILLTIEQSGSIGDVLSRSNGFKYTKECGGRVRIHSRS